MAKPIKEPYMRVPPQLFDDVWKHLQEMIDMWAIQSLNSPWASNVVLVRKKKGKLNFLYWLEEIEFSDGEGCL